ncbi:MAG: hypothetical protein ACTSW1_01440 [Candidatus Hodarchaeales archaeon]
MTSFLTIAVVRAEHYRILYQEVFYDSQSLERVRNFFKKIEPALKSLYPIVDGLNKKRGRPATDRRFQLRFIIWWKFFAPLPQQTAVNRFNSSPELRKILGAPLNPYTRSSLRRFLKDLGEENMVKMTAKLLGKLLKKRMIDTSKVVLDSFQVYSYLNMQKCLRMPKFAVDFAKKFFQMLSLNDIVTLFPRQHKRSAPLNEKLKVLTHQYLWDIPSDRLNHTYIFGKRPRRDILRLEKGWKTVATYRNFLKLLKSLPNHLEVESAITNEVVRVLLLLGVKVENRVFTRLNDLRNVFHLSHRHKDPGITLNYCAAKDNHFIGRGGLLAVFPDLEIPFFSQITAKYKQNENGIITFLKALRQNFQSKLNHVTIYADSEFGSKLVKKFLLDNISSRLVIDNYGPSTSKTFFSTNDLNIRKTIERVIGRLEINFSLEHPRLLGKDLVTIHTQLCVLCDLLLVLFNLYSGNYTSPHSLRDIRG